MIITDVRPQKKSMVAIYLDGKFASNIDRETFLLSGYKLGSYIEDEDYFKLVRESNDRRAKEKALYLIEHRDHSSKELFDKIRKTTDAESAKAAVKKMQEVGLVDDANFARKYARDLFYRKKYAPKRVEYELLKKGINKDIIQIVIEEIDVDSREQIMQLLLGKYKNCLGDEKKLKRTIASLQRLGHNWDDIKSALNEIRE